MARTLEDYAHALRAERVDACEGTHVRHTQPEDLLALRDMCLDRPERELRAVVASFSRADADVVEHAVDSVAALPEVAMCRNREVLALRMQPPARADVAERVAAIRARLAEAQAAELAGHYEQALRLAEPELAAAAAVGYEPVHAEALFVIGRLLVLRRSEPERYQRQALALAEQVAGESAGGRVLVAEHLHDLANTLRALGRPAEADAAFERALVVLSSASSTTPKRTRAPRSTSPAAACARITPTWPSRG